MPHYDYECSKCSHVQEEFHGMKETPKVKCQKCGSTKTHKIPSGGHQINMNNYPGTSPDEVN